MDDSLKLDIKEIRNIKEKIRSLDLRRQRDEIRKTSPYSAAITEHISTLEELQLYCALQLRESHVTRPALVADIDPDLWIEFENATNLDLMKKGRAPYAFPSLEGRVELHHIGQNSGSPFVELTQAQHNFNSHILHYAKAPSWRTNKKLDDAFESERNSYWAKRAQGDCAIEGFPPAEVQIQPMSPRKEYLSELREVCEEIYRQSTTEDLDYLADLAKSYAMMQRLGAKSMGEFLENVRAEQATPIQCPSCRGSQYVLYGTYQRQGESIQRYKCKKCEKVFTVTENTLVSGSSFTFRDWIKFIDCLYNGFTLGQIAKACNISEKAALDNRTKLFYALKLLNDKVQLQGHIVIDETYVPVSYKGNHSKQEGFVMPRDPNKRGGGTHKKGLGKDHVCIACAIDDVGNSICAVAGTGNPSALKLKYALQRYMSDQIICLYSDKSSAIRKYADICGYHIKQEKLLRKGIKLAKNVTINRDSFVINRYLQIGNSYHSRLKRFLRRFSGISTKYLAGYLYLFAWKERNKDADPIDAYKELLVIMTSPNQYLSNEEITANGHIPDAVQVDKTYRKTTYKPSARDMEIGKRYSTGETMLSIAKDFGMTKQNVSLIIKKLKSIGYVTISDSDPVNAIQRPAPPHQYADIKVLDTLIRDYQIYAEKLRWNGPVKEFYQEMSEQYGISVQRVKNVIALISRFVRLKKEIYIYEEVSYHTLNELYRLVYTDYLTLTAEEDKHTWAECVNILAEKYDYVPGNIVRILNIMTSKTSDEYFQTKRKLSTKETYNRDKALFIDYLRWTGKRSDFCRHAAQKYNLSHWHVNTILKYCLYADPKRLDMV